MPFSTGTTKSRPRPLIQIIEICVGLGITVFACIFVFLQMQPQLLFANTTPAGGDMGAHVWAPAFLRDNLLPNFRLTGWTPDWYAGFPAFHFYMVVPSLAIVALDVFLPYGIAFKLVTVAGIVMMPAAAWFLGRMARVPFPGPPLLAAGTLLFLFDTGFTIYGGNIASTLAGEFAFSFSLTLGLVYLGLLFRGIETGKHAALAALVLALTGLSHLIPAFWVIGATAIVYALAGDYLKRLVWLAPVGLVAALLAAFWVLPFYWRQDYLNDMGWEKILDYGPNLRPDSGIWQGVFVLAAIGLVLSVLLRGRLGIFLAVSALLVGALFILLPQGRLWNARILPFYYLSLYLLAALGLAQIGQVWRNATWRISTALVGFVVALFAVMLPLGLVPGSVVHGSGHKFGPIAVTSGNFVDDWAKWNYSGYERKPAYDEYYNVVTEMGEVGKSVGCGRAMWEYEKELDRFGTPMALMLLPHWTDGCIGSMEGLYFEASATTPYHFLNQSELSKRPSRAQRDLPYSELDVRSGVEHLQLLGVKYYMAFTEDAVAQARALDDLTELRTIGEPWAVSHCKTEAGDLFRQGEPACEDETNYVDLSWQWTVFEVADADLVAPLANEPAVLSGVSDAGEDWLEPSVDFYVDQTRWNVFLASDGPETWQRLGPDQTPEARPINPAVVTKIVEETNSISFEVDEPGSPVLVKTSYFPNWKVKGADGPYRVAPNLMVVVPFQKDVRLSYGWTTVDIVAWALTGLGLLGLLTLVFLKAPKLRPLASTDIAVFPRPKLFAPETIDDDPFWGSREAPPDVEPSPDSGAEPYLVPDLLPNPVLPELPETVAEVGPEVNPEFVADSVEEEEPDPVLRVAGTTYPADPISNEEIASPTSAVRSPDPVEAEATGRQAVGTVALDTGEPRLPRRHNGPDSESHFGRDSGADWSESAPAEVIDTNGSAGTPASSDSDNPPFETRLARREHQSHDPYSQTSGANSTRKPVPVPPFPVLPFPVPQAPNPTTTGAAIPDETGSRSISGQGDAKDGDIDSVYPLPRVEAPVTRDPAASWPVSSTTPYRRNPGGGLIRLFGDADDTEKP